MPFSSHLLLYMFQKSIDSRESISKMADKVTQKNTYVIKPSIKYDIRNYAYLESNGKACSFIFPS